MNHLYQRNSLVEKSGYSQKNDTCTLLQLNYNDPDAIIRQIIKEA